MITFPHTFTALRDTKIADKWDGAIHLIEDGRTAEAQEVSETLLENSSPDERDVAELMVAIIAIKQGLAYPRDVIQELVKTIVSAFNAVGWADYKTIVLCGFGMEAVGDYELSRGSPESAAIALLSALRFYQMIHHAAGSIRVGIQAIGLLNVIGRPQMALSITRSFIEDEQLKARLTVSDRVMLLSLLATGQQPTLDVVVNLKEGRVSVSALGGTSSREHPPDPGHAVKTAVLRLVSDPTSPVPTLYRSVVVGNPYLNELLALWLSCDDALERINICRAVLQVQGLLGAPHSGLLAVASRLLESISAAMKANLPNGADVSICAALATACLAYVEAAMDTDDRLARAESHQVFAAGLRLWLAAERIGAAALKCYLASGDNGIKFNSDAGSIGRAITISYPLALEVVGKYADAVTVYRQFVERQEIGQAAVQTQDIVLAAQGQMKETYVRLSRCLFKRYLLESDDVMAVEAAEALELHKARRLRAAILEKYEGQAATWRSGPLRYAASQLPADTAIGSLGINPATVRIAGRWIYVALSGSSFSADSRIWVNEVSPGEQLQIMHEWFTERLALVSRRSHERGSVHADLLSLIQQIVPEAEVRERFRVLGDLLLPREGSVRRLYLSTEHYAFHLPWAGAVAACTEDGSELTVSVVPSSAFVTGGRRRGQPNRSSITGTIYFADGDPMLIRAAEQVRRNIYADSDGGQSWTVELLTDSSPADSAAAELDVVIVLSHGSQASGISGDRLAASLQRRARCVLLLGCWSATVAQDNRHMEIEGTVTRFLELGVEAVVASVWPLPAFAAIQFGVAFAAALESCADPAGAFSAAVQALRRGGGAGSHSAVWGGFALYG